jgi:hypothetical protein
VAGVGTAFGAIGTTITAAVVPAVAALGAVLLPIGVILASLVLFAGIFALAWKSNFLFVRDAANAAATFVKNAWKGVAAVLRGDLDEAREYFAAAWQAIADHVNNAFQRIFGIRDAWSSFTSFLQNALQGVVNFISRAFANTNWLNVGKYILFGIANGMLLGLPTLLLTAQRIAGSLLTQIKNSLGIRSPSKAFEQLGLYSAQGYQLGLARAMSSNDIARTMAKPVNQLTSSSQQNITMQFASGLTMQQVRGMIAENNEQLMDTLISAVGGA